MLKDLKKKHYANSHSAQVPQVFYINGNLVVSSRVVAEQLGKEYKNVIRDLENILSSSNVSQLIIESSYKANNGQEFLMVEK